MESPNTAAATDTPNLSNQINLLSYSSLLTLHSCPRKFFLYRTKAKHKSILENSQDTEVTFDFGHAVGTGIQLLMQGTPFEDVVFYTFLTYKEDILYIDLKRKKSLWHAIHAIEVFHHLIQDNNLLDDYELVYFNGKPAAELSALVNLPGNFQFRLYIDLVLIHKKTGEVVILENKTTSANYKNPLEYRNSAQATGYSLVLDKIIPNLASYKVIYNVYFTGSMKFERYDFQKSITSKASWIMDLLSDVKMIEFYREQNYWPMRGESCVNWGRPCEYIEVCQLKSLLNQAQNLQEGKAEEKEEIDFDDDGNVIILKAKGDTVKEEDKVYDFTFNLDEILEGLLA